MRESVILLLTLMLMDGVTGPRALANDAPNASPAAPPDVTDVLSELGNYGLLVDVAILDRAVADDATKKRVHETIDRMASARLALRQKEKVAFAGIAEARVNFQRAGPDVNPQQFALQVQPYVDVLITDMKLVKEAHRSSSALLTPQQRRSWESLGIRRQLDQRHLDQAKLSPDQEQKIALICDQAGRKMAALSERSVEATNGIVSAAIEACRKDVLTIAQRKELGFPWMTTEEIINGSDGKN